MKRFFVLLLCCLHLQVFAASLPVSRMQNTMSGVVQQKMQQRGFATNDPRYLGTLGQIGSAVAGAAAAAALVTAAGVTAPAWVTAGVTMGVGALFTAGISLAVGKISQWVFGTDGTAKVSQPDQLNVPAGAPGPVYCWYNSNVCAASADALCSAAASSGYSTGLVNGQCHYFVRTGPEAGGDAGLAGNIAFSPSGCVGQNLSAVNGVCPASNWPAPAPTTAPIGDALSNLSPEEKAAPVNPQIIADMANTAWQQAASAPGYDGLPYDATNPITQQDVQNWQQANPDSYANVGDLLSPQPAPSGGSAASPFSMPTAGSPVSSADPGAQPSTGTNPSTQPQENLGADPGIGFPTLENIPTVEDILNPVFGLFPSLKNYAVPSHQAVCPVGTFSVFNQQYTLDEHCKLLEETTVKAILAAAMFAMWALVCLRITLSA